jgi:oxygen-independent coproporphyrinogen-3 oxidase
LAKFIQTEKQVPLDDGQSAHQFQMLMQTLASAGFDHYEISNFAKPNQYSKHNTNYWKGVHYLGIGPSAHSFNGKSRQWNLPNNAKYLADLALDKIPFEIEILSLNDQFNEYIMTSLRTMWGIDLMKIEGEFGSKIKTKLLASADEYISKNWLVFADNKLNLTQEGKLYADLIASELFITENEFQK